jgi:hypothetical protein
MSYLIQPSFTSGEISPSLQSRVDIEQYQSGAKTIKNFIVDKNGGILNRPGTYFIGEAYDSDYKSKLVPFQFSVTQAYILELSNQKMRIIADGGLVVSSASSSVIVSFTTPWLSSELDDLDFSQSADVLYVVHPDYPPYKISRLANDVWSVDAISYDDGPYGSNTIYDFDPQDVIMQPDGYYSSTVTIVCPQTIFKDSMDGQRIRLGYFNPDDITDLSWRVGKITSVTNSATVVVDFSTYREPLGYALNENFRFDQGLSKWEDNSSGTSTLTFYPGTYARLSKGASGNSDMRQKILVPQNIKAVMVFDLAGISSGQVIISIGTTSGDEDIMAQTTISSTGTTISEVTIPVSSITGSTDTEVWMNITNSGSSDGDTADIAVYALITKEKNTNQWRVPSWTDENGYPRAVSFHEQRLLYGSTVDAPNTMWLSKTGDFENFGFESPVEDDDGFQFALASKQLNDIKWIVPFSDLLVGTSGSEWAITNGEKSDAITPTSISARPQSYIGSADIKPIIIESAVVFVQRGGNAVHDTQYNLDTDNYKTLELSQIASHLFEGKQVVSWTYARNPHSVIWIVLDDGTLLGCTYSKGRNIWAWHQHQTNGIFESVASIPGDTNDDVYFVVKRTIDGTDYRYIEQLMTRITDEDTYDFFFVDCGLTANTSSEITTVNLAHLVGETVSILANGSVLPQQTVSASGTVTISVSAKTTGSNIVHIGLPYTSDFKSLDVELADEEGVSQGRKKVIPKVNINIYKSRGMFVGPDEDNLDEVKFRTLSDGDNPISLYTGYKSATIPSKYKTKASLFIRNSDPIPLNILSIVPEIVIGEI